VQISIEVPVFKGGFLHPCIDSVLAQSSDAWTLSLLWDGGDRQSREILEQTRAEGHPRVRVFFAENKGIAGARKFLTDNSEGEYILPLDDDDLLPDHAVARFLQAAEEYPWASLVRARRDFVDGEGSVLNQPEWFPFGPRAYYRGMVTDLFNQAQPYLIRRSAYNRTCGWTGFTDFMGAGEDCDIFLQLEEVAHFEFVDEVLYRYRMHKDRASHTLTNEAAFEMWRRLADATIARIGLPLRRVGQMPPFAYEGIPGPAVSVNDIDFVVEGGGRATESLRRCGVTEDSIHEIASDPSAWRMAGFQATRRRLVCFLGKNVDIGERSSLCVLVETLSRLQADVLTPGLQAEHSAAPVYGECLLVRREVIVATGGFDDRSVPASLQNADLCIQARRRGFSCTQTPVEGMICRAPVELNRTVPGLSALQSKWRSYPALLQP